MRNFWPATVRTICWQVEWSLTHATLMEMTALLFYYYFGICLWNHPFLLLLLLRWTKPVNVISPSLNFRCVWPRKPGKPPTFAARVPFFFLNNLFVLGGFFFLSMGLFRRWWSPLTTHTDRNIQRGSKEERRKYIWKYERNSKRDGYARTAFMIFFFFIISVRWRGGSWRFQNAMGKGTDRDSSLNGFISSRLAKVNPPTSS